MPDITDNNFRPVKGQRVRVVGNCHPSLIGKIVEVVEVDKDGVTIAYEDDRFGTVTTSGIHGGLEAL